MVAALLLVNYNFETTETIEMSEFIGRVRAGEVSSVDVRGQEINITFSDESAAIVYKEPSESLV